MVNSVSNILRNERKRKKDSEVVQWGFATPWIVACQAPPSMGFSRQEYWSGLPFPSPFEEWLNCFPK